MSRWIVYLVSGVLLLNAAPATVFANERNDLDQRIEVLERQNSELRKRLRLQALEKENVDLQSRLSPSTASAPKAREPAASAEVRRASSSHGFEDSYAKFVPPVTAEPRRQSWEGTYIGLHAGGGAGRWHSDERQVSNNLGCCIITSVRSDKLSAVGGVAGAQFGHCWQIGHFVFGPEIDFGVSTIARRQATRVQQTATGLIISPTSYDASASGSNTWLGSVRLTAGLAFDDWLFYATAGGALGGFDFHVLGLNGEQSVRSTALVAGGGVQRAFGPFAVRGEYLYYGFGSENFSRTLTSTGFIGSNIANFHPTDTHIVRVGLDWRFGPWSN